MPSDAAALAAAAVAACATPEDRLHLQHLLLLRYEGADELIRSQRLHLLRHEELLLQARLGELLSDVQWAKEAGIAVTTAWRRRKAAGLEAPLPRGRWMELMKREAK